ncbi:putative acetyl transferase [Yersinia frederiksenii]|uniref:GNAT family N-acetyltransferase n=1 Tax=Yersinia frederiksenii TaxID=29484 RepID=UPI0005E24806|nr:GNAT family N-acetyltransferase [Yersinia frederiksenii]CFQ85845.1 putative acetyl transferase [Yersinia frederiksenii]CNC41497.1 putative acetyl transferase [Yersinia frederiksenii]CNF17535.1 putative acetyl transferase [Yersinia frederiksenii]
MKHVIEVETERLWLRQWLPSDKAPFAALNADQRVMEFFPATLTREESDAMADNYQLLIAQRGWGMWAVELKASRQFVGALGLHIPTAKLPFSPCIEIGWRFAYPFWRQGLATEAALAALEVGFKQLNLAEIVSFTALINLRSQALMARIGMERAPKSFLHPNVSPDSPLSQHCWYHMSNHQWHRLHGA